MIVGGRSDFKLSLEKPEPIVAATGSGENTGYAGGRMEYFYLFSSTMRW